MLMRDILGGLKAIFNIFTICWWSFKLKYKRTLLGFFWEPIITIIWGAGLYLIFGSSRQGNSLFLIMISVVIWRYLSTCIVGAAGAFVSNRGALLSINRPLSYYLYKAIVTATIPFMLNFILVVAGVSIFEGFRPEVFIGFGFLCITVIGIFFLGLGLACACAIYRDLLHLTQAGMRFALFVTPVFWLPGVNDNRTLIYNYNPFTYLLEVTRKPIMGDTISLKFIFTYFIIISFVSCFGLILFSLLRGRVKWVV